MSCYRSPIMSQSQLPALEHFDCESDPTSLGVRWEKWKRALEIYLFAANIDDPKKKRATLLHMGGQTLQDIYFNIPGAHVPDEFNEGEANAQVDVFITALEKLDEYFLPRQSGVYERHLFRLIKQEPQEKFEKFLLRLRIQSAKCKFTNEENIIDQITEKCGSNELRKKILTLGDTATLDKIITEANILESIQRQMTNFSDNTQSINKIDFKRTNGSDAKCSRCGARAHQKNEKPCPAKDKECLKCGYFGHFKSQCRTSASKRKSTNSNENRKVFKKPRFDAKGSNDFKDIRSKQQPESDGKTNINYIFYMDDDTTVNCNIGGVNVELLIDSGSTANIISEKTWTHLKGCGVRVSNQVTNSDKIFMAYGSNTPLTVLGSFEADISLGPELKNDTFYVIKDGNRDLLGKNTAIAFKVLKLGLNINSVSDNKTFPKFKGIQLNISIDKSVTPVSQSYRRVPIPIEEKVNNKINELIELDIIEPVDKPSGWVSPIVPVLKNNGDVRICVDMRCANKAIIRENHPLPTMDQLLPQFGSAKVFSKLDIKDAFHQAEISESSRDITTFITNRGLFRYKRLMFGISCAPELFQKTLERILLPCQGVVNFIDDIVVFGKDDIEHRTRLNHVLSVLKSSGVLLNDKKCIFNVSRINFLGHELSSLGVKPLDSYVRVIDTFRPPNTIEEVQSFLGLVNYVNKWIPNFSTITEPIRRLLILKLSQKSDISVHWKSEQAAAFEELKACLRNVQSLGFYDPRAKTQVMADASPVGLGAVLVQHGATGPRIIAYGNKSLSEVEKRYCQTEKEALALVWAVEHFHMFLYGKESFDLVTDHKPLEVIFGTRSKPSARIERWVLRLQAYNFTVIYRPGKVNIADPLSRLCIETKSTSFNNEYHINQIVDYARPIATSMQTLVEVSQADEETQLVLKAITSDIWDPRIIKYRIFQSELWMHEGILLRGDKIVIPLKLRQQVLDAAHEGHPGIIAMKGRLRTKVWWPKIDKDAESRVRSCKGCTLVSAGNPPLPLKRRDMPSQPWEDVAIDFLGPLPSGHYLFVVIDYYSRYKEIKIMKSITAKDTIKVLNEMFSRLGLPLTITADNGRQFISEEFKTFCQELGIKIFHTTPYCPQQNGEVERQNRDILKRLRISQSLKSDWQKDLLEYLMMYNSTPHSTTGKTPFEIYFCRKFRDKIPSLSIVLTSYDSEVRDHDKEMKDKGKRYADLKRKSQENELPIGEKVYVKNLIKENKLTTQFNPAPHTVISSNGGEYNVRNDETGQEYKRNIIHLKKVEGEWRISDSERSTGCDDKENIEDKLEDICNND